MSPSLPWELIFAIILQAAADTSTILSLCLTSKSTKEEAQIHLYRDVFYSQDTSIRGQIAFLETMISEPSLALLVRHFTSSSSASSPHMPTWKLWKEKKKPEEPRHKVWRILPHALRNMQNLEKLEFREVSGQPSAYWILPGVEFQLRALYWECHGEGVEMANFLATQRCLETISLEQGPSCPLDPSACLTVRSLYGNPTSFVRFLPGRPNITQLDWVPSMDEDIPMSMAGLCSNITHLSIGGYFGRASLTEFAPVLPSLQAMHLQGLYSVSFI